MDIVVKFMKAILFALVISTIFAVVVDFGKAMVVKQESTYIASNANSYVNQFGIEAQDLLEYEIGYKETEEVKTILADYFRLQYENSGYRQVGEIVNGEEDQLFLAYDPAYSEADQEMIEGDVYVRALLYGFDGTPSVPSEYGDAEAVVEINIENKIPSTFRHWVEIGLLSEDSLSEGVMTEDYEGYWGYYDVIEETAFEVNIVE